MSRIIYQQRPAGGCERCGGPVRTRKDGHGWTCARCVREIARELRE
ncbi:hypothetical protein [Streptomyces prunicolor]